MLLGRHRLRPGDRADPHRTGRRTGPGLPQLHAPRHRRGGGRSTSRSGCTAGRSPSATPNSPGPWASSRAAPLRRSEVREAVLELRRGKGMVLDPADPDTYSAGSFFTNPILDADARRAGRPWRSDDRLRTPTSALPGLSRPPTAAVKLSAAWLIERAGFAQGSSRTRRPGGRLQQAHSGADQPRRHAPPTCSRWPARSGTGCAPRSPSRCTPEPVLVGVGLDEADAAAPGVNVRHRPRHPGRHPDTCDGLRCMSATRPRRGRDPHVRVPHVSVCSAIRCVMKGDLTMRTRPPRDSRPDGGAGGPRAASRPAGRAGCAVRGGRGRHGATTPGVDAPTGDGARASGPPAAGGTGRGTDDQEQLRLADSIRVSSKPKFGSDRRRRRTTRSRSPCSPPRSRT